MAAESLSSLTSTSHTLSAAPIMAPATTNPLARADNVLAPLLASLRPENRYKFLQPSAEVPTESLRVVKDTLEGFAGQLADEQAEARRLREKSAGGRKRKRVDEGDVLKVRRVYVDGFETGQVWQQAKKIIGGVLGYADVVLEEMEERNELVMNGVDGESDGPEEDDEVEVESDEDGEELDSELIYSELIDVEGDDDEEEIPEDEEGLEFDAAEDDDGDEEGDEEEEDENEEYVGDPDGLNDGFFNLDEFNKQSQWFEDQDARGDPNTDHVSDEEDVNWDADPFAPTKAESKRSKEKEDEPVSDDEDDEDDGPTFGNMALDAPEGDSDDEAMDGEEDEEGMDFGNANEVYYKDFFAPPPRKSNGKPRKNVRFQPKKPDEADVERAMADVRRDLFDDESDNDLSEDALSDVDAGDPRSRRSAHERRQAKIAEEIRKLENASIAKREWTLSGEATAVDRPTNSLLEHDLDFEHIGKPVPVITPEITESIEDLIKRRILAQEFDEVVRRRPDSDVPTSTRRGLIELDDSKPNKSLAEVYEEEHIKNTDPDSYVSQSDEKLQREEKEIEAMWRDVSSRLDALSSWHFKPKPAAPSLSVVADVATVSMEDAQPTTAQGVAGSTLAPQEVYKASRDAAPTAGEVVPKSGLPVARQEMSREDKTRRRRREKERVRKAGGIDGKKVVSGRAKMQRDTIAELKKGGVKVINRKGEITDVEGKKAKTAKAVSSGSYKL